MSEKKAILSVKTEQTTKELLAKVAGYLNINQGDLATRSLTKYITDSTDYISYLKTLCKKHGLHMNEIIHEAVRIEGKYLLEQPSPLVEKFYDSHDLWATEKFENIPPEDLPVSIIERSDFSWEWELFLKGEIMSLALNRIDAETNEILNISSDLLLTLIPSLKKMLEIEVNAQINLFATSRPIVMAYYIEIIGKVFQKPNTPPFSFHYEQLSSFMEKLTIDEEIWFYTVYQLLESELNHNTPSVEKAAKILNDYFNADETYPIFKSVKVDNVIKKAIETPGPYSLNNL